MQVGERLARMQGPQNDTSRISYFGAHMCICVLFFPQPWKRCTERTQLRPPCLIGTRSIALCCFFCIRRQFWFEWRAWLLRAISAPAHASQMQPTHQCLLWVSVTSPCRGSLGHPDCSVQTEQRGPADECSVSKLVCLLPVPLFCT